MSTKPSPGGKVAERERGRMRNGEMQDKERSFSMEQSKKLKPKAQTLRKNATKEENLLWYKFLRLYKPQFRRQYVIGDYIVDFYCHKAKLVVELDGSQHCEPENMEYDQQRTAYLNAIGLQVLRISNLDVMRRFNNICDLIDQTVKMREKALL